MERRRLQLANSHDGGGGGKLVNNIEITAYKEMVAYTLEIQLDYPLASLVKIEFDIGDIELTHMYKEGITHKIYTDFHIVKPNSITNFSPTEDDMYIYNVILNV